MLWGRILPVAWLVYPAWMNRFELSFEKIKSMDWKPYYLYAPHLTYFAICYVYNTFILCSMDACYGCMCALISSCVAFWGAYIGPLAPHNSDVYPHPFKCIHPTLSAIVYVRVKPQRTCTLQWNINYLNQLNTNKCN